MNKTKIDKGGLIDNYLPADYLDSFSTEVETKENITPDDFFNMAFSRFPAWIDWLLKLRNMLVKPLGLDTTSRFSDSICERDDDEIIWGMPDKHLTFHVSMWCGEHRDGKQELRIITVVKYNNWFGRAYFFVIRPFHGIIIKSILKNIEKKNVNLARLDNFHSQQNE